jgi:hypothetical protein
MTDKPSLIEPVESVTIDVRQAPELGIDKGQLDAIAATALAIAQTKLRQSKRIIPKESLLTPWQEHSEETRANAREHATCVIQALVLLGWLEKP